MSDNLTKLNAEPKRLWLEALRSGKYEQGIAALALVNQDGSLKHCCLGVACELAYEAGVVTERKPNMYGSIDFDSRSGFLPESVQNWLGVDDSFIATDSGKHLTELNDVQGFTFDQIADVIEAEL